MAGKTPKAIPLNDADRKSLEKLIRGHKTPQDMATRARIIVYAAQGLNHREIAAQVDVSRETTRKWRHRWCATENTDLSVRERLQDAPRSGAPLKFTPEQLTHVFAIACEEPQASGRPISHWTARELADELIQRGIVEAISIRHVGRLLAQADLKPHQIRYWLTPGDDPAFEAKANTIAQVYRTAAERSRVGERTLSCDEMTGVQALERIAPDLPLKPGRVARREFEYQRHGTQTLIANFDVVTGQVISPYVRTHPQRSRLSRAH